MATDIASRWSRYCFPQAYAANPDLYPDKQKSSRNASKHNGGVRRRKNSSVSAHLQYTWNQNSGDGLIRQYNLGTAADETFDSGVDRITTFLAFTNTNDDVVILVSGESSGSSILRVFHDSDDDEFVEESTGATIVAASQGMGTIGGVAWLPLSTSDELYLLDVGAGQVYALSDTDADDVPDALGSVYADTTSFLELAGMQSITSHGEEGASLSVACHMISWDDVFSPENSESHAYVQLQDTDADGVADTSSGVLDSHEEEILVPVIANVAFHGQSALDLHGSVGNTVNVWAFESSTSDYTELLGTVVLDAGGDGSVTLTRTLHQADELKLEDVTDSVSIEDVEVEDTKRGIIAESSLTMGLAVGGDTVTLDGECLPIAAAAKVWFGAEEGTVVFRSATQWVVESPVYTLPTEYFDVVGVTITCPGKEDVGGVHFTYVPYLEDVKLYGSVFLDANSDGVLGGAEDTITGVLLDLLDAGPDEIAGTADDVLVASAWTRNDGGFSFDRRFPPGTYTLEVDTSTLPAGVSSTTGGDSRVFVVQDGDELTDEDFGYW